MFLRLLALGAFGFLLYSAVQHRSLGGFALVIFLSVVYLFQWVKDVHSGQSMRDGASPRQFDSRIFHGHPYIISADWEAITCATCGRTSHNIHDVVARYCGHCHVFHSQPDRDARRDSGGTRPIHF